MRRVAFIAFVVFAVICARFAAAAPLDGVAFAAPEWSPVRQEIAFWAMVDEQQSCGSGESERMLFVVGPDGSNLRRVDGRRSGGHVWYAVDDVMDRAWSPDGSKLAFTRLDGAGAHGDGDRYVQVVTRTGEPVAETGFAEPTEWAPDSQRLALMRYDPIAEASGPAIFDLRNRHEQKIGLFFSSYARWSPRGDLVAYQHDDYLFVERPNGTRRHRLVKGGGHEDTSVAGWPHDLWSGDGKLLAFFHWTKEKGPHGYVIQPDGRNMRRMPGDPDDWAWAPRGRTYAFGRELYDFKTRRRWRVLPDTVDPPQSPVWSPNGQRLVYPGEDALFVVDRNGRHGHTIRPPQGFSDPSWSADSRTLTFSTEHGIYVIDADGRHGRYVPLNLCEALTAPR